MTHLMVANAVDAFADIMKMDAEVQTRIKNALYLNVSKAYSALVSMNGFHL